MVVAWPKTSFVHKKGGSFSLWDMLAIYRLRVRGYLRCFATGESPRTSAHKEISLLATFFQCCPLTG